MMARMFGTDGIRGVAGEALTCELAMKTGRATASILKKNKSGKKKADKPLFLIGCDTRISGDMLCMAVAAGILSAGGNVKILGAMPTPAVAYITKELGANAGIEISASHNPYEYNGIKIFGAGGYKLLDEEEDAIEALIRNDKNCFTAKNGSFGMLLRERNEKEMYISHIKSASDGLSEMKIALDCANGATTGTAARIFSELGAKVVLVGVDPDGMNINSECGSLHTGALREAVKATKADVGFAFDGDGDRCIAVDENGDEIDGDIEMAILAKSFKEKGELAGNILTATVMSNIGLRRFAEENGMDMHITTVGDRYVLEDMLKSGGCVGGEQSGHIICSKYMTTGDGELTAVLIADYLKKSGKKMSEAASIMKKYPQYMENLTVSPEEKEKFKNDADIDGIRKELEKSLGDGRILFRVSGTEPLIRVMAEGEDLDTVRKTVGKCIAAIEERLKK